MWQPPYEKKKESKKFLVWYLSQFLTESLLGPESKSTNSWYSPLISQRSVPGFVEYTTVHSSGQRGGGASYLYPSWTLVLQISNCVQRGWNTSLSPDKRRKEFRDSSVQLCHIKSKSRSEPTLFIVSRMKRTQTVLQLGGNKSMVVNSM